MFCSCFVVFTSTNGEATTFPNLRFILFKVGEFIRGELGSRKVRGLGFCILGDAPTPDSPRTSLRAVKSMLRKSKSNARNYTTTGG